MGKLVVGVTRFLLFCTLLSPIWLVPTEALAYGESISVYPASGPVGLNTVIRTSRPPVTADVYGCSLQVPGYLVPSARS